MSKNKSDNIDFTKNQEQAQEEEQYSNSSNQNRNYFMNTSNQNINQNRPFPIHSEKTPEFRNQSEEESLLVSEKDSNHDACHALEKTSNKKEMTFDNVSVKKFKDIAFALASKKISLTKIIEVKIIQDFLYESPKEIFDQNNSVSKDIQNFIGTSNSKAFTLANLDELSERLENNGCLSG